MIRLRRVLAATAVAIVVACKGDSTGPVAGTLKVNLATPNSGADGAVMLVLSSPVAPSSVAAGTGLLLWGAPVTSTTATIALTGTLSAGTILTLHVDDTKQVAQYSATLIQVAMSSAPFTLRPALLTGYSLTVAK